MKVLIAVLVVLALVAVVQPAGAYVDLSNGVTRSTEGSTNFGAPYQDLSGSPVPAAWKPATIVNGHVVQYGSRLDSGFQGTGACGDAGQIQAPRTGGGDGGTGGGNGSGPSGGGSAPSGGAAASGC